MIKALLISIQPQHAVNILNGKKTLELRSWMPKDYKGWVYVYVTKGKPYLVKFYNDYPIQAINDYKYQELLDDGNVPMNGKVAFRFWFDEYDEYKYGYHGFNRYTDVKEYDTPLYHLEELQLDYREIETYGNGKPLYAWHINKLEVFDKPKELSEFYKTHNYGFETVTPHICKITFDCEYSPFDYDNDYETCLNTFRVKKAPKKMQWVYVEK